MRFLSLADDQLEPGVGHVFNPPYSVDLSIAGPRPRVAFAEGRTHGSAGGHFGVRDALGAAWRDHFVHAGGEWIRDYLVVLARGGTVTSKQLIDEYVSRHGGRPKSYDWDLRPIRTRFLQLASSAGDWRLTVDVSVDERPPLIAFSEGTGPMSSGGVFSLRSALAPQWAEHIEKAGGTWLLPLLQQMAEGDDVVEQQLIDAFTERHGTAPGSYELTTMNWRG